MSGEKSKRPWPWDVMEWVADSYHDSYLGAPFDEAAWVEPRLKQRVLRGGAWNSLPARVRCAARIGDDAEACSAYYGFRVLREL